MKLSKVIPLAAWAAMAAMSVSQMPVHAAGNAHKYPVVPPKEAAPAVVAPVAAPSAKPADAAAAKPATPTSPNASGAASTWDQPTKPAQAAVAKPAEAPTPTLSERLNGKLVIVSRYEPLSTKDTLEVIPDFNRGHGKGK